MRGGFDQQQLEAMTPRFRSAAHWLLFAETLVGPEGLPEETLRLPEGGTPEQKRAAADVWRQGKELRDVLFPEDVTDG